MPYLFLHSQGVNMRLKLNVTNLLEDQRKLALGLMGGGILGLVVDNDKITTTEGWIIFMIGFISWIVAIILSYEEDDEDKEV